MKTSEPQKKSLQDRSIFIPESILQQAFGEMAREQFLISQAGCFTKAQNHYIKRRGIDEHIVMYCTEGRGFIRTESDFFECRRGDLIFCRARAFHEYGADDADPWSIHWFHIRGTGMDYFAQRLGLTTEQPLISIGVDSGYTGILEEIHTLFQAGYTKAKLIEGSIRLQYFFLTCQKSPLISSRKQDAMTQSLLFITRNIQKNMCVEELADTAGISKYHYIRLFKQKTGYTPLEYINRHKIQKACDLLLTKDIRICEISDLLGFSNPFYFSTVFKRIIGCAPREYKKLYFTFR